MDCVPTKCEAEMEGVAGAEAVMEKEMDCVPTKCDPEMDGVCGPETLGEGEAAAELEGATELVTATMSESCANVATFDTDASNSLENEMDWVPTKWLAEMEGVDAAELERDTLEDTEGTRLPLSEGVAGDEAVTEKEMDWVPTKCEAEMEGVAADEPDRETLTDEVGSTEAVTAVRKKVVCCAETGVNEKRSGLLENEMDCVPTKWLIEIEGVPAAEIDAEPASHAYVMRCMIIQSANSN
jgi:hypothetical protein